MGRKRKGCPTFSPNYLKIRHRYADTKYRSKLQCLFKVLKSELSKVTTKDHLLKLALAHIMIAEDAISNAAGSKEILNNVREDFLSFLPQEEAIWKREKNVDNWWFKVQDLLHNKSESMAPIDVQNLSEMNPSSNADDKKVVIENIEQSSGSCSNNFSYSSMDLTDDSSTSNQRDQDLKFNYSDQIDDIRTFHLHDAIEELKPVADESELFAKGNIRDCFFIDDNGCHQLSQNGKNFVPVPVQDKNLFPSEIQGNKAIPVFEANNLDLASAICSVLQ